MPKMTDTPRMEVIKDPDLVVTSWPRTERRVPGVTYIGVDPGKKGGLARIGPLGEIELKRMPGNERDLWEWFRLAATATTFAVIEKVHAMPGQGVTSMFTFGRGFGSLLMALTAARIPYEEVRPEAWMKSLGIASRKKHTKKVKVLAKAGKNRGKPVERGVGGEDKGDYKKRLIRHACNLFPDLILPPDEYTADALLMAEYARRIKGVGS